MAALATLALTLAWLWMARESDHDRWHRNTEMNMRHLADALSLNSGFPPGIVDQPAAPTKFLLALDYRLRNEFDALPTWTLKRFARSPDPIAALPQLVQVGRVHSRVLVIASMLLAGWFVWSVTRRFELACLAVTLMGGSSGLLFHGLLVRPELLCVVFGGVLALQCAWLAMRSERRVLWLLLAGFCAGVSLLSKLPGLLYLLLLLAWCGAAPRFAGAREKGTAADPTRPNLGIILPIAAGTGLLILLQELGRGPEMLHSTALWRLRVLAAGVALLPLVTVADWRGPLARYAAARGGEVAVVLAGVMTALLLWFGLLRTVLSPEAAADYMARILSAVAHPDPLYQLFTHSSEAQQVREAFRFFLETPVLIAATGVLALTVAGMRSVPADRRLLVLLLLAQAGGMVLLLSRRQFLDHYSIFVQVPLLLIWALALASLREWWRERGAPGEQRWPVALATTAALFLALVVPVDLGPKYHGYQEDAAVPVRDLTVTYLYDHDALPSAYLEAMRRRYPSREQFAAELNRFLLNPAHPK